MKNSVWKVLDLFAGTQSVKKALSKLFEIVEWRYQYGMWLGYRLIGRMKIRVIEYVGVDIKSPEDTNTIFDLSTHGVVSKLKNILPAGFKPDFIWSSPQCNKFSTACAYKGGNLFFEKTSTGIKVRNNWNEVNKAYPVEKCKLNKVRYQKEANLALTLHANSKAIIDYYKSPFIIENPRRAMSKYLYEDLLANYCSYCMYGYEYEKPTAIYSNMKLNLKTCIHGSLKKQYHTIMLSGSKKDYVGGRKNMSSYTKRSSVPPKLIIEILEEVLGYEKK